MFSILVSALNLFGGFLLRSVVAKLFLFFGLYFVTTEFIPVILNLLPGTSSLSAALSGLSVDTWYVLDLFRVDVGLPAILSAMATRFIIRRIPLIG